MPNSSQPKPALEHHQQVTNCLAMLRDWNSSDMWKNRIEGWLHLKRDFPEKGEIDADDLIDACPDGYQQMMAVAKFILSLVVLIEHEVVDRDLAIALFAEDIQDWVTEFDRIVVPTTLIPQHDAYQSVARRVRGVVDRWPKISQEPEGSRRPK
jgi:hypothetical protein